MHQPACHSHTADPAYGISAVTSVWTWGNNSVGELGDDTRTSQSIPVRVTGGPGIHRWHQRRRDFAAAMGTQRLGLELGQRRQNISGQVQVTGVTIAAQIAAGGASSFAVRTVAYLLGS